MAGPDFHRTTGSRSVPVEVLKHVFLLKGVTLFKALNTEQILPVADIVSSVSFEKGDTIFHEGDEGHQLYVVVQGSVEVVVAGQQVAVLGVHQCFGEMAVLEQLTRSATVRAIEDVSLLRIAREDFLDLLDLYPVLARSIIAVLTERLRSASAEETGVHKAVRKSELERGES